MPMPMPIHQLENCKLKCNPPQHRYALNISFFCTDKSSSNFYPNRGVQDGEWGNQTLTHALELGNVACNTISGIFAVRMIETCLPSPSSRAKHCRTIWEMKFPTSPPLCFQSHTIVAQQKSRRHNISRLLFLKTFNWLSFSFRCISIKTNCGFCSNRILPYFPMLVSQLVRHRRDISSFLDNLIV